LRQLERETVCYGSKPKKKANCYKIEDSKRVLSDKYSFFMVGPGTKKRQMT